MTAAMGANQEFESEDRVGRHETGAGPTGFGDCWFLTGPTASGKTEVGVAIAERLGCEIVALDSMTLYRGMEIGVAKPGAADRTRVPHHLLDVLDPNEPSSIAQYLELAGVACRAIRGRGRQPLFVGGTPLYLKACLRGLFDGPPADAALRARLEAQGSEALHRRLLEVDPLAAARIAPRDLRRLVRALEVFELTGRPISSWQQQFDRPAEPAPRAACLLRPRAELYERVNQRVLRMLDDGWIDEVRLLFARYGRLSREALQAAGVREIKEHLEGRLAYTDMVDRIQTRTRQLCKRQLTWFRHLPELRLFETSSSEPLAALVERLCAFFAFGRTSPAGC